jgi:hypothetical protein
VEREDRVAILVLNRPYHNDPGLNHGIPDEFQVLGYPILSMRSIPKDKEWLKRFYAEDDNPLSVMDVWPENYSANSAQKVWATKFAARHPNVVVLDLSSFKCGHDAPTYGIIDGIVTESATPYAALHDIDANKPGGSIKIRVKTYAHSLKLYEETLEDAARKKTELALSMDKKRLELLELKRDQLAARRQSDPAVEAQIAALGQRLLAYKPVLAAAPELPVGFVTLKKKNADGTVVPVNA